MSDIQICLPSREAHEGDSQEICRSMCVIVWRFATLDWVWDLRGQQSWETDLTAPSSSSPRFCWIYLRYTPGCFCGTPLGMSRNQARKPCFFKPPGKWSLEDLSPVSLASNRCALGASCTKPSSVLVRHVEARSFITAATHTFSLSLFDTYGRTGEGDMDKEQEDGGEKKSEGPPTLYLNVCRIKVPTGGIESKNKNVNTFKVSG